MIEGILSGPIVVNIDSAFSVVRAAIGAEQRAKRF
jgi:hypothetical protein